MQLSNCVNNISAIHNSWKTTAVGELVTCLEFCCMAFLLNNDLEFYYCSASLNILWSSKEMQQDTGSILHSIITAKPHKNMQPANRSVKAVLGTAWQWYPNPTWNCCFGRYASAEEILRPKRPIWSQPRAEIKSSERRTSHSLHVCGLVCSKCFFRALCLYLFTSSRLCFLQ